LFTHILFPVVKCLATFFFLIILFEGHRCSVVLVSKLLAEWAPSSTHKKVCCHQFWARCQALHSCSKTCRYPSLYVYQ